MSDWLWHNLASESNAYLQWLAQEFPDSTQVIHTYPDGWTINRIKTWGDFAREGGLMHNCWANAPQHIITDDEYRNPEGETVHGEPTIPRRLWNDPWGGDDAYTLRDESGIPHGAFYWDEQNKQVFDALGRHNSQLKPAYRQRLMDFFGAPIGEGDYE